MMNQNNDTTGLGAFRQNWWSDRQPSGFPSFLTGPGANTSGQDNQGAQLAQATARAQMLQGMAPEASQGLQDAWGAQDQGGQPQSLPVMLQALQAQARRQQLRTADPDVAQHLQTMWAAQDRAGR